MRVLYAIHQQYYLSIYCIDDKMHKGININQIEIERKKRNKIINDRNK